LKIPDQIFSSAESFWTRTRREAGALVSAALGRAELLVKCDTNTHTQGHPAWSKKNSSLFLIK